jgi:hypothetical protein
MKQLLGMTALFPLGYTPLLYQVDDEDVPQVIVAALKNRFPDADDIVWASDEAMNKFAANFNNESNYTDVHFDKNGNWLETIMEVEVEDIPDQIMDSAEEAFPELEYVEGISKIERGTEVFYELVLTDEETEYTLVYDAQGNLLEKTVNEYEEGDVEDDDFDDDDFDDEDDDDDELEEEEDDDDDKKDKSN